MKSVTAGMDTELAAEVTHFAKCIKLKSRFATVVGLTSIDVDLKIDLGDGDGPVVYKASPGFKRSNARATVGLGPDQMELEVFFDDALITDDDLREGAWDDAAVEVFEVVWNNLGAGRLWSSRGTLGKVTLGDHGYTAEFLSLQSRFGRGIIETIQARCMANFGDARCKKPARPPAWQASTSYAVGDFVQASVYDGRTYRCTVAGTSGAAEPVWDTTIGNTTVDNTVTWEAEDSLSKQGQVLTVTDNANFTTDLAAPAGEYTLGVLTWLTGANAGRSREVKLHGASAAIELYLPAYYDIQAGDTYLVTPGCDKRSTTCRDRYDNILNYRGFEFVPQADVVLRYPDAV